MPYKSDAQRSKFHVMKARGEIDPATVAEFDRASKGKQLPERVGTKNGRSRNRARRRAS
jgi:hypothetical protein